MYPNDIDGSPGPRDRGRYRYRLDDRNGGGSGKRTGVISRGTTSRPEDGRSAPKTDAIVIGLELLVRGPKDGRDGYGLSRRHTGTCRLNGDVGESLPLGLVSGENENQCQRQAENRENTGFFRKNIRRNKFNQTKCRQIRTWLVRRPFEKLFHVF